MGRKKNLKGYFRCERLLCGNWKSLAATTGCLRYERSSYLLRSVDSATADFLIIDIEEDFGTSGCSWYKWRFWTVEVRLVVPVMEHHVLSFSRNFTGLDFLESD